MKSFVCQFLKVSSKNKYYFLFLVSSSVPKTKLKNIQLFISGVANCFFFCPKYQTASQGDQMFLLKNRPKTIKNRPKSCPNIFLLVFLYKTVLWCFLFDFMLISNGTGHSFIVFLYIKEEINFFEYF